MFDIRNARNFDDEEVIILRIPSSFKILSDRRRIKIL